MNIPLSTLMIVSIVFSNKTLWAYVVESVDLVSICSSKVSLICIMKSQPYRLMVVVEAPVSMDILEIYRLKKTS